MLYKYVHLADLDGCWRFSEIGARGCAKAQQGRIIAFAISEFDLQQGERDLGAECMSDSSKSFIFSITVV